MKHEWKYIILSRVYNILLHNMSQIRFVALYQLFPELSTSRMFLDVAYLYYIEL